MKMNPYDFVRVDWHRLPSRHSPILHHHFGGLSGRLAGTITAETPLFVKKGNTSTFVEVGGQKAIPGSALKGMFRSVVETVAQGCFCLFDGEYKSRKDGAEIKSNYSTKLPRDFARCSRPDKLCPACRLFGLISGETLRLGNVSFGDAACENHVAFDPMWTPILEAPKPRHDAWYLSGMEIAGRKFYFHSEVVKKEAVEKKSKSGVSLNARISPVGAGSEFTFTADFTNVAPDDFAALLYALVLEPGMRHKIGYAKPCGLGSIHVALTKLALRSDPCARYRQGGGEHVFTDAALDTEINSRVAPFVATIPTNTLSDLRRIWQWPPPAGVTYAYPTQPQFAVHPTDAISTTDTW